MEADDQPKDREAAATPRFVRTTAVGAVRVLALHLPQALDSEEFDHLNETLLAALDGVAGQPLVLDLTGVDYMGSSVLGLMVNARQRVKAGGGRLVLCGMSAWLVQTFRTCSLERLFEMVPTQAEAVRAAVKK